MAPVLGEPTHALANLRSRLDGILTEQNRTKAVLGARVIELPSGRVLYDREGRRPMVPASNMKLIVMAAAIDQLGRDYQFTTVCAIRGTDLVVFGGGDPTFGDERLAKQRGRTITAVFEAWADSLVAAGVRQIPGNVVVDDSIFDDRFTHPNWPQDQYQKWYEAPVGGLNFNANCAAVEVRPRTAGAPAQISLVPENALLQLVNRTVTGPKDSATINRRRDGDEIVVTGSVATRGVLGPVTVRDPGLYFGHVLKAVLEAKGIRVFGDVVRQRVRLAGGDLPPDCYVLAVHRSPLEDALSRAGKRSLGMMAEALIKSLGHKRSGVGSWEAGRRAVTEFLRKVGVPEDQAVIDEGSGLSRVNRLSAAAATDVLHYTFDAPDDAFKLMLDSLARAGIDGTMEKRCRWPTTRGRVYAKTGYIKAVRTLAGYVHTGSDRWLAFAFYYNNAANSAALRQVQDEACRVLAAWPDISPPKQWRPPTTRKTKP